MLDLQYEIPSKHSHVAKLTVTKDAVEGNAQPLAETDGANDGGAE